MNLLVIFVTKSALSELRVDLSPIHPAVSFYLCLVFASKRIIRHCSEWKRGAAGPLFGFAAPATASTDSDRVAIAISYSYLLPP